MPFESSESLLTRCDLMAKPTPASRRSFFLRPLQKNVQPVPTIFNSPSSARQVSHRAAISTLYRLVVYQVELFYVVVCLPALFIKVRTFHTPIVKAITFISFFLARPLNGIPADRGLPAKGFEAGNCLGHLF